jgi:hypothetical protein
MLTELLWTAGIRWQRNCDDDLNASVVGGRCNCRKKAGHCGGKRVGNVLAEGALGVRDEVLGRGRVRGAGGSGARLRKMRSGPSGAGRRHTPRAATAAAFTALRRYKKHKHTFVVRRQILRSIDEWKTVTTTTDSRPQRRGVHPSSSKYLLTARNRTPRCQCALQQLAARRVTHTSCARRFRPPPPALARQHQLQPQHAAASNTAWKGTMRLHSCTRRHVRPFSSVPSLRPLPPICGLALVSNAVSE